MPTTSTRGGRRRRPSNWGKEDRARGEMKGFSLVVSFLFIVVLLGLFVAGRSDDDGDGFGAPSTPTSSTQCTNDLSALKLPFSTTNFSCNSAWSSQSFMLMYQHTGPNLWSFVLVAPDNGGYISVGFSPSGGMIGSSAVAGWVPAGGAGVVKQYKLNSYTSSQCPPDTGVLKMSRATIVSQASKLYMAFQLDSAQPESKLVYAVGSQPGSDSLLPHHSSMAAATIDYTTGQTTGSQGGSPSTPTRNTQAPASSSSCTKLTFTTPFDTSSLSCAPVWSSQDFILYYKQTGQNQWSFVLSAPDNNGYITVGFSSNGKMVGTSAVAGWVPSGQNGTAKQYYLGGTDSGSCPPDQGSLQLVQPWIVSQSSRLYLGFQLNVSQPESRLIYAVGSLPGSNNLLPIHSDKISTSIDYTTGLSSTTGGSTDILKKSHGSFALLGWGVLMPIGVTMARYFKHKDPFWFYAHISIQGIGFVFGVVGVLTGFALEDKVAVEVDTHKSLGIVILVFGCLQVMAILARPDKAAKIRRYWNWYHHNIGRLAIALGIANIFYGISLAKESQSWSITFGVFLGAWLVSNIVLEIKMRLRK